MIGLRGQAMVGVVFFFGIVAVFSTNLRAVNWQTILWGVGLQVVLALLVLGKDNTYRITAIVCFIAVILAVAFIHLWPLRRGGKLLWPGLIGGMITVAIAYWIFFIKGVHQAFDDIGGVVRAFIDFSDQGAQFVFGNLAKPGDMAKVFGNDFIFCFAFKALPPILFVSAFFTVLYHFGVLQWCVRALALVMVHLMRTSGAETLSVAANVFMGQTEAPLIVKPYVPRMSNSELFVLMASGMAHISGGMMVVYISYGADPVAVLTTCVMACPCSLYLSKLFLPEVSKTETGGTVRTKKEKSPYVNAIDAAATGTTDGLSLAMNVGAMLIVFIAFVAMFDAILGSIGPLLVKWNYFAAGQIPDWLNGLSLGKVFGWIFSPVAFLMGVAADDVGKVGSLLQTIDQRTLRLFANAAATAGFGPNHACRNHARSNQRAVLLAHRFRINRLCELFIRGHSTRRYRRDCPQPSSRFGALGHAGAIRRFHRHAIKRVDCRNPIGAMNRTGGITLPCHGVNAGQAFRFAVAPLVVAQPLVAEESRQTRGSAQ
jgi:CNT family concentrative nucleoside transporter